MAASSASDTTGGSTLSRHEAHQENFRKLTTQALLVRGRVRRRQASPLNTNKQRVLHAHVGCGALRARALTPPRAPQGNARLWLSQFSPEPLPDEDHVPFATLITNGALLSRVGAALLKATQQGLSAVPPVVMRSGEAWEAPAGAARAGRASDDAASFVAACRSMGVRTVECCAALDITHPGPASTRAVRSAARFCVSRLTRRSSQVCVTLYALSLRCKALGLRVAPFPVADLSFPSEDTKCVP